MASLLGHQQDPLNEAWYLFKQRVLDIEPRLDLEQGKKVHEAVVEFLEEYKKALKHE